MKGYVQKDRDYTIYILFKYIYIYIYMIMVNLMVQRDMDSYNPYLELVVNS